MRRQICTYQNHHSEKGNQHELGGAHEVENGQQSTQHAVGHWAAHHQHAFRHARFPRGSAAVGEGMQQEQSAVH